MSSTARSIRSAYDLLKDLEPVALLPANPQLIVTKPSVPAKDLKELIAWVKENQEQDLRRHRRRGQRLACQRHLFPAEDRHELHRSCRIAAPGRRSRT